LIPSEIRNSAYLGFLGIFGFLSLVVVSVIKLMRNRLVETSIEFWSSLWILLFSIVGGLNMVLGVMGIQIFRATNRLSVVILMLSLFFLVRNLSKLIKGRASVLVACGLGLVHLLDAVPGYWTHKTQSEEAARVVKSDVAFAATLEGALPAGAKVFQLPVMEYPEVPPIVKMQDYEHFRPYFFSTRLRYSYGTAKGRSREAWQKAAAALRPEALVKRLEEVGFNALYINRNGLQDPNALEVELNRLGYQLMAESEMKDLVVFRLHPAENPKLPDAI
jgi:phosphoglycerol transferase